MALVAEEEAVMAGGTMPRPPGEGAGSPRAAS